MPIEEISDYPEKMTEFELHWQSVNTELGGTPETEFKLGGDFDLAQFSADKAAIVANLTLLEGLDNNLDFARADRDTLRSELRQRLILFRDNVSALLPGSRYERALPDTPQERADQDRHLKAMDDAAHIWQQINTDAPAEVGTELILRGGYTLALFNADLATMRARYDAVQAAERALRDGRGVRDELLKAALGRMSDYRKRLPLVLEPDDPLLASMPQLYPAGGTSAPDAPTGLTLQEGAGQTIDASWDAVTGADHYVAFVQVVGVDPDFVEQPTTFETNSATLGPYDPGATIRVKVQAVSGSQSSPDSDTAELTLATV